VTARGERIRAGLYLVVAFGLAGATCGSDDGNGAAALAAGTTTESSLFVVEDPPDGYRLVLAGRGDYPQTWSSDTQADDQPVTVLAPPGEGAESPDAVTVSLSGYAYQGELGLHEVSAGYLGEPEEFEIGGKLALYTAPGTSITQGPDADLVVAVGEDVALKVRSATGIRDELTEVARRVDPPESRLLAPVVSEPPDGLEVVGHADADVALTLEAVVAPASGLVPAGERAHTALWVRLDADGAWTYSSPTIAVSTLPGTSASLDVLAAAVRAKGWMTGGVQKLNVADRPAVVLEFGRGGFSRRTLVTSTPGGDLLLVVAGGADMPAAADLAAVAASVRPASAEEWEALVPTSR
jgi:hypothetical protein